MLTIYFTRHGQTEWNVEHRMQGWGNGELTELGRSDAYNLAVRLNNTHLDKIYSSTSKRAYETAEIISNGRNITLIKNDLFREMYFGEWDGMLRDDIITKYPDDHKCFWETPHLFEGKGGETFFDIQNRAKQALQLILDENKEGTVLVVAHSIFLRVIFATLKNLPIAKVFEQNPPGNTSLTKVVYDGKALTIEYEGDMSHAK
ncbi:histidine phosphatase family protein [Bacillus sp. JJ722]|uniref:histidine phosphatase family protein n=1 Tax=Bacillus sp. JJ722 TaxID=3122973 RepID=UPI002FFFDB95